MSHNEVTPILMVISYLLGWAVGGPISVWARKEELLVRGDDIYIDAYDRGFDNALQDAREAVRDGYADWCCASSQRQEVADVAGYIYKRLDNLQGKEEERRDE